MKLIKELQKKAEDLRNKVKQHCAAMDFETPVYPEQDRQVAEWIQSHSDVLKKILELRLQIQRTNLATNVTIELDGKQVTKPIAGWIHRRRELAGSELAMWSGLTDRGLKEGQVLPSSTPGVAPTPVKIVRYYKPAERDKAVELYRTEPGIIDRTLEVVNATTTMLE